mgnify:CR=1 FL=1
MKRVFLIVLDSVGIGEMPDAADYGDAGSNTIRAAASSPYFSMPNMRKLGFFNIDGVEIGEKEKNPSGSFARMTEVSKGKDTQSDTGRSQVSSQIVRFRRIRMDFHRKF